MKSGKWRLILSGQHDPSLNMGIDFALWQSAKNKLCSPTLRFYEWKPPSVSIGYNQDLSRVINVNYCANNGIPIVQRPTGGSAIFHDVELTYSFCSHNEFSPCFTSAMESYLSICEGLKKGLESLGVGLEIRGYTKGKEPSFTGKACFVLSSRHDLVWKGKKIIGSAQRRSKTCFLQHGSILIDIRKSFWERVFAEEVDFGALSCLKKISGDVSIPVLIKALVRGFEETFSINFCKQELCAEEEENARRYAEMRFPKL